MSGTKESFSDEELTAMAAEIMKDLQINANLDPTVSSPYLFTPVSPETPPTDEELYDINISNISNNNNNSITPLNNPNEQELYQYDLSDTNSHSHTMTYLNYNYPLMSPEIVSESKSFQSFPSIPPIPINHPNSIPLVAQKPAINGWCQFQFNNSCKLPYIKPPNAFIDELDQNDYMSNVALDISPRKYYIQKRKRSEIPLFDINDINENNNDTVEFNNETKMKKKRKNAIQYRSKKKKKKKRRKKRKPRLARQKSKSINDLASVDTNTYRHKQHTNWRKNPTYVMITNLKNKVVSIE